MPDPASADRHPPRGGKVPAFALEYSARSLYAGHCLPFVEQAPPIHSEDSVVLTAAGNARLAQEEAEQREVCLLYTSDAADE